VNLHIPDITEDMDNLAAALAYAEAGWFVLPVKAGTKHPGSIVGDKWPSLSSRDPKTIAAQFAGTDHGIALHCGRSGALVLDVDNPDNVPDEVLLVMHSDGPYQSTRADEPDRGHYLLLNDTGRRIGNSLGKLATPNKWGEVRGANGVIIAEPTVHPEGGQYRWVRTGPVPSIPDYLAEALPESSTPEDTATDAQVAAFLDRHSGGTRTEAITGLANALKAKLERGASCHMSTLGVVTSAMAEAAAGLYPARQAADTIWPIYRGTATTGTSTGRVLTAAEARHAFNGILAWAVGQATPDKAAAAAARLKDKMPDNITELTDDDGIRAFKLPDGHRATDVGNAERLVAAASHQLRYVHAWGKWIVYHGGRWIVDDKDALVTEIAKQVPRRLYKLAAATATTDNIAAAEVWKWALKTDNSSAISSMIRLARGTKGLLVNHEHLDADPWLFNVANGTIDLRTGNLRPHNPADLCTLQAPVNYDPEAQAPLWEKCLQRWQPDPTVLAYVQTRAGAGATGIPTETVDVDYGGGGNGKSKFHGGIQLVLGPYATVPHKSLLVTGRFEQHPTVVAALFRKRLAVAAETKAVETLDDESVKNLTGGDRLKARRMREDEWEFWPSHTLIMASNHKPTVQGRDEGIWRRLRLVPWTVTIPEAERDGQLSSKLAAEAPGILRWVVQGAARFHRDGLNPPPAVLNATAQYRADEDTVGRFIEEALDIRTCETGLRSAWCYSIDLKDELDDWCDEQSISPVPSMNDLTAILKERGCKSGGRKQIRGKRSTIWHGVSVKATDSDSG
jgi:P4 family phage/plasmid primase-like protien